MRHGRYGKFIKYVMIAGAVGIKETFLEFYANG